MVIGFKKEKIEIRFPYNKKIIQLIRTLKDNRGLPMNYAIYDGEKKNWTFKHSDVTAYYLTLIAARYDFKFVDDSILLDYDDVKKEIIGFKLGGTVPIAKEALFAPVAILSSIVGFSALVATYSYSFSYRYSCSYFFS